MEGEFFEVHGSKFKPAPFADLRKVSDEGVAHPMLLFRSSETPLDRFFSLVIELSDSDRLSAVNVSISIDMTIRLLHYKEETSLAKLIHSGTKLIEGEL